MSSSDAMTDPARIGTPREATLLEVVNAVLRARAEIGYGALAGGVLLAGISLLVPPTYIARTAFIQSEPARAALPSNLGNLAARLGVAAPTTDPTFSLDFLREALTSQDVLDSVLVRPLTSTGCFLVLLYSCLIGGYFGWVFGGKTFSLRLTL